MKKSSLLLLCAGMLLAGKGTAQTAPKPCYTDEMRQLMILQHPEILKYEAELEKQIQSAMNNIDLNKFKRTTGVDQFNNLSYWYDIPVVIHIIHDYNVASVNYSTGFVNQADYVSDDEIFYDLISWNQTYACQKTADTASVIAPFKKYIGNPHIRLHLATIDPNGNPTKGITRRRSYLTYNAGDQAKYDGWDPTSYVNIWTIHTMSQSHSEAAAYATPPSSGAASPATDGIICINEYLDNDNTINHEMGHMFNLAHPWGSTNSARATGVTCASTGSDNVDDTPPTLGHNLGYCSAANLYDTACATNYFKIYLRPSTGVMDSLVNYPDTTNAQNVMDYTYCSKMFTIGQCRRMAAALNSAIAGRNNLWDTANLIRTGVLSPALGFTPRPDLPPIPEFAVSTNTTQSYNNNRGIQYITKPGANIVFKNRTWNDTVTRLVWTFTNGATISSRTDTANLSYTGTGSILTNSFSQPGWVSLTMAATGNHTSTTTKTWDKAIFVTDANATSAVGYYQEFNPAGDAAKWPLFNYYSNEFKWEQSGIGLYDNNSLKYNGFESRAFASLGFPQGDVDDFFSTPMDLTGFGSGPCNLNFFSSGASRTSNSLDITDTFEIAFSTDMINWTPLDVFAKGKLANMGAYSTAYAPTQMSDWVANTINLPATARKSYVVFRFRYRPGVDHYNPTVGAYPGQSYSTGNNFYIDRIHFSAFPAEVSGIVRGSGNIVVAPNPTSGNAYVMIKDADNSTAHIVVSDITGKVVYTTDYQISGGDANVEIPAAVISVKGVYLVQTSTGKQSNTQKLVVY